MLKAKPSHSWFALYLQLRPYFTKMKMFSLSSSTTSKPPLNSQKYCEEYPPLSPCFHSQHFIGAKANKKHHGTSWCCSSFAQPHRMKANHSNSFPLLTPAAHTFFHIIGSHWNTFLHLLDLKLAFHTGLLITSQVTYLVQLLKGL